MWTLTPSVGNKEIGVESITLGRRGGGYWVSIDFGLSMGFVDNMGYDPLSCYLRNCYSAVSGFFGNDKIIEH